MNHFGINGKLDVMGVIMSKSTKKLSCQDCNHLITWHHAKMMYDGKLRTCFGIACMCTRVYQ